MAKATALDKVRRVRQRPKPKSQSAQIGPDGPKHPGNRQLYDKRGRPDAGARLYADYPNPKVATFCAALWLTFTLPLTNPEVKIVGLGSPGGAVVEAIRAGYLIRARGLETTQIADCFSACPIVFLGGSRRTVNPGAILAHGNGQLF